MLQLKNLKVSLEKPQFSPSLTQLGLATPFSVLTSSVPQLFTLSFSSLHVFTLKKNRALPVSPKKTLASSTAAAVRRAQKLRLFVVLQPLSSFPCSSSVLLAAQSRFARRLSSCSSPSSVVLVPRRVSMAERSKELLHLEHKATPLSSLESTLLVCNGKREQCTQAKILPPNGTPLTSPIPKSQLLGKVKDFLGVMSEANKRLELDAKDHPESYNIEELTGNESKVIEMDLMLGVADLNTPEAVAAAESAISSCQPAISLAADGKDTDTDSDESSAEDDNEDDGIRSGDAGNDGRKPSSLDDEKRKGNHNSKKRARIVELS
ncbi:uncharacterized protein DS421_8g251520 [Arachis hypogaea]|nr:uncharacterized protein DS421_8g251520 [Arachis hypogaea]